MLITSAQFHPWVRVSVTILFSQYTLVLVHLETTVMALKKAMVSNASCILIVPFPPVTKSTDAHAEGLVDKIRTQPTRMHDEECGGRTGVGRTNQNNPR